MLMQGDREFIEWFANRKIFYRNAHLGGLAEGCKARYILNNIFETSEKVRSSGG
jgi:hypothetical protein